LVLATDAEQGARGRADLGALFSQMIEKEAVAFNLDCHNLHSFDPELYNQLVQYPQEVIPIFDFVVQEEAAAVLRARGGDDDDVKQERLQVRTYNLMTTKHMRELNPTDIDQMVCIRGMVTRTTGVQPDLQVTAYSLPVRRPLQNQWKGHCSWGTPARTWQLKRALATLDAVMRLVIGLDLSKLV